MEKELQLVIGYLDGIATKLGVGIGYLWPWFVKQQYIEAGVAVTAFVICSALFFYTTKFAISHWDRSYEDNKKYSIVNSMDEPIWIIICVLFGFLLLCSLIGLIVEFPDIFNPEYHALRDIIYTVK